MVALRVVVAQDGVFESRFFGVVDVVLYFFVFTAYAFHEGFFIVFKSDVAKRHRLVRGVIIEEKGVGSLLC